MANTNITRNAMGRTAAIGDLYNVTKDSFCNKSIFPNGTDFEYETIEHQFLTTSNQFYNDDNQFNNFIKFDVELELAVSALCGLVSYSFLNESVSKRSQSASLLYTVKTKTNRLDVHVHQSKIKRLINAEEIMKCQATHVVVGIDWGSWSALTIENSDENDQNTSKVKQYLEHIVNRVIRGEHKIKTEKVVDSSSSKYTLDFNSDILAADGVPIPKTEDDIVTFLKDIPNIIESEFDGHGKCLSFVLFPLSAFCDDECFHFAGSVVHPIEPKVICSLGDLISKICDAKTKLHAIQTLTDQNEHFVPEEIRNAIRMKRAIVDTALKNITDCLVKVRKEQSNTFEFEVIQQTFQASSLVLDQFLEKTRSTMERIGFLNYAMRQGALYIGNISSFEEARRKIKPKDEYYVLFYACCMIEENTVENVELFTSLMKGNVACIVADLDMNPGLAEQEGIPKGVRVCHYNQNGYKDYDVYKTYKNERVFNLMRPHCEMQPVEVKPRERAIIHLVCPGSLNGGECNSDTQQWKCVKCKSAMEYGFDKMFYCDCGRQLFMNGFELW